MKTPRFRNEGEELYILADELEQGWRRSLHWHTEKELVEIFAPPPEMIREKLDSWEERQATKALAIKETLKKIYRLKIDDFSKWFGALLVKTFLMPGLEECNCHIARLKRITHLLNPRKIMENTNQEILEKARGYPIYEIAKNRLLLRECGNKLSSLCPFHEEKHASFYIYLKTNTFHCFGCQAHGDVITLTMHLYGTSFREAIKMLQ